MRGNATAPRGFAMCWKSYDLLSSGAAKKTKQTQ
nr:MAG TPA: hypothetical protein [Caudoviricetes sp.]